MPEAMTFASRGRLRQAIKRGVDVCCTILLAPCGWMCALEAAGGAQREAVFSFWAQTFALVPGLPGTFMRRAFYRMTLESCAKSFYVGFGAFFSHRQSTVEEGVYIGPYSIVGSSRLRRGCLIGSRAGIISGAGLHAIDASGRRTPTDPGHLRQVEIGENVWIGEGCLIMADIGHGATVAAGSVVSSLVPSGIVVAGNPARFVRRLAHGRDTDEESARAAV
jgi:acetyltransferase-like isoleucine patch superfamily enzyme